MATKRARLLRDGVIVVTVTGESDPIGVTANSFTSVSLAPPLVLFCVANSSRSLAPIKRASAFAVNILGKDQEQVWRTFAAKVDNRFAGVSTCTDTTGSPVLADALAFLGCEVAETFERRCRATGLLPRRIPVTEEAARGPI